MCMPFCTRQSSFVYNTKRTGLKVIDYVVFATPFLKATIIQAKDDSAVDFSCITYMLAKPVGYCTQYRSLIIVQILKGAIS
jgi:hypothetical protein